jgi:hypothetical protein
MSRPKPHTQEEKSKIITHQDDHFYTQNHGSLFWGHRKWIMSFFMFASDMLCLILSASMALTLWYQVRHDFLPAQYISLIFPVMLGFGMVYFLLGLYPALGIGPVEELRRLTMGSFFIVLSLGALSFYLGNAGVWSRAILGLTWLFITISIPLSRKIFRRLAVRWHVWGMPVAIIGDRENWGGLFQRLTATPAQWFLAGHLRDR